MSRTPLRQRPRSRLMAVFVPVSSMKTSRVELSIDCLRFHNRRARATSGRVCSLARRLFFKADLAAEIKSCHRAAAPADAGRPHSLDHLIQSEVWLLLDGGKQKIRMCFQWRSAAPAQLCADTAALLKPLNPSDGCTRTHV